MVVGLVRLLGDPWVDDRWTTWTSTAWNACRRSTSRAIRAYEEVESAIHRFSGAQTVLVRVDSVDTLRRAYPNYFADTALFLAELKNALDAAE